MNISPFKSSTALFGKNKMQDDVNETGRKGAHKTDSGKGKPNAIHEDAPAGVKYEKNEKYDRAERYDTIERYDGAERYDKYEESEIAVKSQSNSGNIEDHLSDRAKEYLAKLREKYGDYDFFVAESAKDFKTLGKNGSKEYSVLITADELEKMAADEEYGNKMMKYVEDAVAASKKILEEAGYASAEDGKEGKNGRINRINIEIHDDGSMKIFAELERTSDKQRERIEKAREKKAEEKKAEDKKAEKRKAENAYRQQTEKVDPFEKEKGPSAKRTVLEASTPEELLDKLRELDWDQIPDSYSGDRFNFTA